MLTDSGVNAMSNRQLGAMMEADDAYAGSQSFVKLDKAVQEFFGMKFFLPVHQGRAAEHIIARTFIRPGDIVPMNFHFTTTRAQIELAGGRVEELIIDDVFKVRSDHPFKGNMDLGKLEAFIKHVGVSHIPFVRLEVTTNLTGGQPVSLKNIRAVAKICRKHHLMLVIDACLIAENAFFIHEREPELSGLSLKDIILEMSKLADIVYFSGRKLGAARGGGIVTNRQELFDRMKDLIPLFEGFFTYGGMSMREIEALAIGLTEFTDERVISQMPQFIDFAVKELDSLNIPVVTPGGALGIHLNAQSFIKHVPQNQYPAGALAAAIFLISGIRGMERGTISTDRDSVTGKEIMSRLELVRLAVPRRVFTLSQINFLIDRVTWLFQHKELIHGLKFVDEPKVLRFFGGRLRPVDNWDEKLVAQFKADFGESL
jgi:tyrosine phenol-lyase